MRSGFILFSCGGVLAGGAVGAADAGAPEAPDVAARPAEAEAETQPYRLSPIVVTGEVVGVAEGGGTVDYLSGAVLRERMVESPRGLTAVVPNLTVFDANGDRLPRMSVRGFRENNFGYGEVVATVYLDGVPYYDSFSRGLPLYNVESGEFLKGPQGTLYGASRSGGVLNLYTHQPGEDVAGYVTGEVGNYGMGQAAVGISGPLVADHLYGGLDGLFWRRDGYFHNLTLDTYPDDRETYGGRAQVRWAPSERLDLTVAASVYDFNDGALVARPVAGWQHGFWDLTQNYDGTNEQNSQTYSLRAAWRGEDLRLVNVVAYRLYDQELTGDFDFSPGDYLVGFDRPDLEQWSEEFRVESVGEDLSLRWSAGVFAAGRTVDRENGYTYGSGWVALGLPPAVVGLSQTTTSETKDLDMAVFGNVIWSPSDPWDLTAGIRGEVYERRLDRQAFEPLTPPPFSPYTQYETEETFSSVQPKLGVTYHVTERVRTWFMATTGYQPGGFSLSAPTPELAAYDPSYSVQFELGLNADLMERQLTGGVSLFWIPSWDYQVYHAISLTDYRVLNADQARTLGAEVELEYRPVDPLEFRLAAGFADATFVDFEAPDPLGGAGATVDLSGNTINFVPEFTLNAEATYRFGPGFFATLGGTVVGRYYFDEANRFEQPTFALMNARLGWGEGPLEVALFGTNLTGTEYYANALDLGYNPIFGGFVGTPGDPRLVGVQFSARF